MAANAATALPMIVSRLARARADVNEEKRDACEGCDMQILLVHG
jgi:hypothetical protein